MRHISSQGTCDLWWMLLMYCSEEADTANSRRVRLMLWLKGIASVALGGVVDCMFPECRRAKFTV